MPLPTEAVDSPPNFVNLLAYIIEYLNNTFNFKGDIIQPDRMGLV